MYLRTIAKSGLAVVLVILVASCSKQVPQQKLSGGGDLVAPMVKVQSVRVQPFTTHIKVSGELQSVTDVTVSSQFSGRVEAVRFGEGDAVAQGQVLVTLDSRMARAQLEGAKSAYWAAKSAFERQQALLGKKMVPSQNLEAIQAQMQGAKAQYDAARLALENAVVKSPLSGVAVQKFAEVGEVVNFGSPLVEIVDISQFKLVVGVSQSDSFLIRPGSTCQVFFPALNKRIFAHIRKIGVKVDSQSKLFPVEIRIPNVGGSLRAGLFAEISIQTGTTPRAVVIPGDAIQDEEAGKTVVIVQKGKSRIRSVILGGQDGNKVEIRSGLSGGDQLIVEGQSSVFDGQAVHISR